MSYLELEAELRYPAPDLGISTLRELHSHLVATELGHITGEDPSVDNTARAQYAAGAVRAFATRVGLLSHKTDEGIPTGISDLVADLMHLCDAAGLDPQVMLRQGIQHYEAELAGE